VTETQDQRPPPSGAFAFVHDILLMTAMLTRLPVPVDHDSARPFVASLWAVPLVGAGIGAVTAGVVLGAAAAGATPLMAAVAAVAVSVLLTGCFHEDGLADTADGLGGGRDAARKREIMKDSRLGTYGAAALLLTLLGKIAVVAALVPTAPALGLALVAAAAASRAATVALMAWGRPAGGKSLAATARPSTATAATALAIAAGACLALGISWSLAGIALAVAAGTGVTFLTHRLARRQIGGHTGDILGAVQILSELALLYVLMLTLPT